jgi:hypothetical protein
MAWLWQRLLGEFQVSLVNKKSPRNRSYLGGIIQEIQALQLAFTTCSFQYSHRSSNIVAHNLAQMAHSVPNAVWIEEVPSGINDVYCNDLVH